MGKRITRQTHAEKYRQRSCWADGGAGSLIAARIVHGVGGACVLPATLGGTISALRGEGTGGRLGPTEPRAVAALSEGFAQVTRTTMFAA
jgi:hypothetical protein